MNILFLVFQEIYFIFRHPVSFVRTLRQAAFLTVTQQNNPFEISNDEITRNNKGRFCVVEVAQ